MQNGKENNSKDAKGISFVEEELKKLKGNNPFEVPENYFDNLPEAINELKNRKKSATTVFLNHALRPVYYYAAAIILLLAITLFLIKPFADENNEAVVELSWEDVIYDNYYVYSDLNTYNIIENLLSYDGDIDYSSVISSLDVLDEIMNPENDSNDNTEDIINYLVDEGVSIYQIAEQ
jgi:hypothetical protein